MRKYYVMVGWRGVSNELRFMGSAGGASGVSRSVSLGNYLRCSSLVENIIYVSLPLNDRQISPCSYMHTRTRVRNIDARAHPPPPTHTITHMQKFTYARLHIRTYWLAYKNIHTFINVYTCVCKQ